MVLSILLQGHVWTVDLWVMPWTLYVAHYLAIVGRLPQCLSSLTLRAVKNFTSIPNDLASLWLSALGIETLIASCSRRLFVPRYIPRYPFPIYRVLTSFCLVPTCCLRRLYNFHGQISVLESLVSSAFSNVFTIPTLDCWTTASSKEL